VDQKKQNTPLKDGMLEEAIELIKDIVDRSKSLKKNDSIMTCYAFIIHLFSKKYMFHIWTRPYRAIDWHRSSDGRKGRLFWVERYK